MSELLRTTVQSKLYQQTRGEHGVAQLDQLYPPDPDNLERKIGGKALEIFSGKSRVSVWQAFTRTEQTEGSNALHLDPRLEISQDGVNYFSIDSWDSLSHPQSLVATIEEHFEQKDLNIVLEFGKIQRSPGEYQPPIGDWIAEPIFD